MGIFQAKTYSEISDPTSNLTGNKVDPSVESLEAFSESNFPNARESFGLKYEVGNASNQPSGFSFDAKSGRLYDGKNFINGVQRTKFFGKSELWIAEGIFSSDKQLFRTLGHELIHGWHSQITPFYDRLSPASYSNLTESVAHNWSLSQGLRLGVNSKSSLKMFHKYYSNLTINQLSQYHSKYHWRLSSIFNSYK